MSMRIRYGQLTDEEQRARAQARARACACWQKLARTPPDLDGANVELYELDPRLSFVLEAGDASEPAAIVIDSLESAAWPLAALVLAEAPVDCDFLLGLGRPARSLDAALSRVRHEHGVDFSRAPLRAGFSRGHLLELALGVPGGQGNDEEQLAAEHLCRLLLGDRLFETWVGSVHVEPAPRPGSLRVLHDGPRASELFVSDLFATVAAAVVGLRASLPRSWNERLETASEWTLLELDANTDEARDRKPDLLLTSTCVPELSKCFLEGAPVSSQRFASAQELFVYVVYRDDAQDGAERLARRALIEACLSAALAGFGGVVGVGIGRDHCYIDVVLTHVDDALARLAAALGHAPLPATAQVRFFDAELAEEWLSISPSAPASGP